MIKLTEIEIAALEKSVDALKVAEDWHDLQECLGDAMGFDISNHVARRKEIREEINRLQKELES